MRIAALARIPSLVLPALVVPALLSASVAPALAAEGAAEGAAAGAAAIRVQGTVRAHGGGDPIPEATVTVQGGPAVTTDARGRFALDAAPGAILRVLAPGFLPAEVAVPATAGAADRLTVWLRPDTGGTGAEIVVESDRDAPAQSEQRLDRERVLETPGTFEDPVRLVQSLPGVTVTPEYSKAAGDIAVRGAAPGENRFFLDGIELPYLYHYNQYASVFHTRLLDELTLVPSTGPAQWGDLTGAVIDTRSVRARPASARGSANLNLVMSGAEIAAPIGDRWSLQLSGRRSYLDLVEREDPWYTSFPLFWDYFGRVSFHPDPQQSISLLAFGAGDSYTRLAVDPSTLDDFEQSQNASFAWDHRFHILALQHRLILGPADAPLQLDGSLSATAHRRDGALSAAAERLDTGVIALREDLLWIPAASLSLAGGLDARLERLSVTSDTDQAWPGLEEETELLAEGIAADDRITRLRAGAYAEARWSAGPLRLIPALRADADTLRLSAAGSDALLLDPRLAARLQFGDTRLRLAGGRYSALPRTEYLITAGLLDADPATGAASVAPADLPATRSWQAAAGIDQVVARRLEFSLDGYAKFLTGLSDLGPDGTLSTDLQGRALGAEFTSRYRLRDLFFTSLSLSLSHATRADPADPAALLPYDYDQPFALNAVASYSFAPTWNVGIRYRLASGLPYTPAVDGIYDAASDTYAPVYGEANSLRLPMYQKIDLHVEKRIERRWWNLTLYAEAWYVPPANNVMYVVYRYDYDDSEPVHGPGFVPLVGARGEF